MQKINRLESGLEPELPACPLLGLLGAAAAPTMSARRMTGRLMAARRRMAAGNDRYTKWCVRERLFLFADDKDEKGIFWFIWVEGR